MPVAVAEGRYMATKSAFQRVADLARASAGAFRIVDALSVGVSEREIRTLCRNGLVERTLPGIYVVAGSPQVVVQKLHAALLWSGEGAAVAAQSAGELLRLEGVHSAAAVIAVPASNRKRHPDVRVIRYTSRAAMMVRRERGIPMVGTEAMLCQLGSALDREALEIACEDARRRKLTSIPALRAYLDLFGASGRNGVGALRDLLNELDPLRPSNSVLEVKVRRLLIAHGLDGFVREFPLEWRGRRYYFDFCFPQQRVILETNGQRWHDDVADYEFDNEKWSVPGRLGYRIVFATWRKALLAPLRFIDEVRAALDSSVLMPVAFAEGR